MSERYVSKGEWFDAGTSAELVEDCSVAQCPTPMGIFRGLRNGVTDEELCTYDEFIVVGGVLWA